MKVTHLGQAGLLFEKDGIRIMIDPYLSNSIEKVNPKNRRNVPINESFFELQPDVMIFTHNHLDHYDPETVCRFVNEKTNVTILAPSSVWVEIRKYGGNNNYVLFNPHTEWSAYGMTFMSVKAEHSDPAAIGVIICDGDKKCYITGDTLYNSKILNELPSDIDYIFLPINGKGNNMNMTDAARFVSSVGAKIAIPIHIGMFDNISAQDFECSNKMILNVYVETQLY
ncbi:MAG: MBL fold metallo-hydrolase [Lachnospiraceae bacterium]|nr:MBL fold metallo-hydrolase [Lachnospiraceae bacterium]